MNELLPLLKRGIRRTMVAVAGAAVVLAGLVLIVLPGPLGFVVVPAGIAILATEFVWARVLQGKMKQGTERIRCRMASWGGTGTRERRNGGEPGNYFSKDSK